MPPPVGRLASIAAVALGALASAAPALADNAGLTPVDPKSPNAEAINDTYYLLLGVTGVVFFAVEIALVVFLIRYRRRNRPVDAEGPQIHGNTRLEVMWTIVPVFLVAIVVAFVFYKLPAVTDVTRAASEPADDPNLVINVEGRRFYWEFRYPDGRITYDTMVVPVDRTVELNVTAPDFDVIHSWWIPALGGKIDAIPGKLNHTWFRAESSGDFEGNCTEFCGLQHAEMTMIVRAVDAGAFEAELTRLAGSGQAQFEAACGKCHNLRGPQLVGPTLGGNPTLADRQALATLLREGRGEMPAIGRGWTDAQLDTLFAYTRGAGGEQ
jgi:cytochrome c oxidase subunit II